MKITDLARMHQRYLLARGGSARTAECYDLAVAQFVAHLRRVGLEDDVRNFTPQALEAFVQSAAEAGLSPGSINVKLAALSSLGRFGARTRDGRGRYILIENPASRVERPRKRRPRERFLTVDELRALLAAPVAPPERLALVVLVDTALRVGEVVEARVRDLGLGPDGTLRLTVRLKGGDAAEVPLGPAASRLLEDSLRLREARPDEPLLVSATGRPYTRTSLSEMVARAARRAGITRIPVRAHTLRHTVATLAAELGVEVPALAGMLNHRDLSTVGRYAHTRAARVDAARAQVRHVLGLDSTTAGGARVEGD